MRAFFDTNVFVYAFSDQDATKGAQAIRLIERHRDDGTLVISTQVLVETFNVLARKRKAVAEDVLDILRLLADEEVFAPTARTTLKALELATQHGLTPWDAMIVQAAIDADCAVLYSEDMQGGRRFGRLEIINPFHPAAHQPLQAFGGASTASTASTTSTAARLKRKAPAARARRSG